MSSSMKARTSRLSSDVDDIGLYKERGSKAAYVNSLDSSYSDDSVLQRNIQQMLKAELKSETMKGTCEYTSA